jgi:hypothetical protein
MTLKRDIGLFTRSSILGKSKEFRSLVFGI